MQVNQRNCIRLILLSILALLFSYHLIAQNTAKHPYASAQPIGEPKLFAEGIINIDGEEYGPAFTPDGKSIYFARRINNRKMEHIYVSHFDKGKWSTPEVAPFSGQHFDKEPFVSPDGKKIFFASRRPVDEKGAQKDFDIWFVEKTKQGWSAPTRMDAPVNSAGYDNYPAVSANGTLYFGSVREGGKGEGDLYRCPMTGGRYTRCENLGDLNTAENEADPYVAPDESFIIFSTERANGAGEGDLLISYNRNGKWSAPQSLGPKVNTSEYEYTPLVSPDKKYLFFSRGWGKIYQLDMSALNLK